MIKWVVLWTVINYFPISCPQPAPVPDEYGRDGFYSSTMTLQMCYDIAYKERSKEFDSLLAAEEFIDGAKKVANERWDSQLSGFRIQEVRIIQK
jgi:hypothetical protein